MAKSLSVDLDQLIVGHKLSRPIHDTKGVLLAGNGTEITAELKERLLSRGISCVLIDESDAVIVDAGQVDREARTPVRNESLENLIRSGMMSVRNAGPLVRDRVVRHGCQAYDADQQAKVAEHNRRHVAAVDELLDGAIKAGELDAVRMDSVAKSSLESLVADVDAMLATKTDADDRHVTLAAHSFAVGTLAMAIGMELGLNESNLRLLGMAGLLADLGLMQLPPSIREAPRTLTGAEFIEIQKHPIHTANILEQIPGVPPIVKIIVYQIRERPDGTGYPRGRKGEGIHPFAGIVRVADAYTAMTSPRAYRGAMPPYEAMTTLLDESRRGSFDRCATRALLNLLSLFPVGSFVLLTDGSIAQVLRTNSGDYMNPIVRRIREADGEIVADDDSSLIDLATSELRVVQAIPEPVETGVSFDQCGHNDLPTATSVT